jgi:hypothetical protein
MATIQQGGSAVTGNVWSGTSTNNNHGTANRVGTTSAVLENREPTRSQREIGGSVVVDGNDTDEALSASTIAYNNQSPIAMRLTSTISGQSNAVLRSASNAPGQLRSINKRESYKVSKISTAYRNGYWDPYIGKFIVYGTYSRSSNTVTVSAPHHGLVDNDYVSLDFTSGNATDGRYVVTVVDANSFTVTDTASGSTSGNVTVKGPAYNTENPGNDDAATVTRSAPGELVFLSNGAKLVRNRDYSAKTG